MNWRSDIKSLHWIGPVVLIIAAAGLGGDKSLQMFSIGIAAYYVMILAYAASKAKRERK